MAPIKNGRVSDIVTHAPPAKTTPAAVERLVENKGTPGDQALLARFADTKEELAAKKHADSLYNPDFATRTLAQVQKHQAALAKLSQRDGVLTTSEADPTRIERTLLPKKELTVDGLRHVTEVTKFEHPQLGTLEAVDLQTLHAKDPRLANKALDAMYKGYLAQFPDPNEQMEKSEFKDALFSKDADPSWNVALLKQGNLIVGAAQVNLPEPTSEGAPVAPFIEYGYRMPIAELADVKGVGDVVTQMAESYMKSADPDVNQSWIEVNPLRHGGIDSMPPQKRIEFWEREGYRFLPVDYRQHPLSDDKEMVPLMLGVKVLGEHPANGEDPNQPGFFYRNGELVGVHPNAVVDAAHAYTSTWAEDMASSEAFAITLKSAHDEAAKHGGLIPVIPKGQLTSAVAD